MCGESVNQPLRNPRAVLVSLSPRRRRLVGLVVSRVETAAVDTPESLDSPLSTDPHALVASLALEKLEAARLLHDPNDLIMCFDTVVVAAGRILGKPADRDDARRMLRDLSGSTHQVLTAMALGIPDRDDPVIEVVETDVLMNELDESAIDSWLASDEPLGCAGAYNIEGQIASVGDGECFQNVAGFPLCHVYRVLRAHPSLAESLGANRPIAACDALLDRRCLLGPRLLDADGSAG